MNKKDNPVLDATILLTTYGVVPSTYSCLGRDSFRDVGTTCIPDRV